MVRVRKNVKIDVSMLRLIITRSWAAQPDLCLVFITSIQYSDSHATLVILYVISPFWRVQKREYRCGHCSISSFSWSLMCPNVQSTSTYFFKFSHWKLISCENMITRSSRVFKSWGTTRYSCQHTLSCWIIASHVTAILMAGTFDQPTHEKKNPWRTPTSVFFLWKNSLMLKTNETRYPYNHFPTNNHIQISCKLNQPTANRTLRLGLIY
jgi:hypothetical protein